MLSILWLDVVLTKINFSSGGVAVQHGARYDCDMILLDSPLVFFDGTKAGSAGRAVAMYWRTRASVSGHNRRPFLSWRTRCRSFSDRAPNAVALIPVAIR